MTHKQLERANVVFNRSSLRQVIKNTSKRQKTELEKLRAKAKREKLENEFLFKWKAYWGPNLKHQHKFHATRKWAFDFAHLDTKTAIEIDGGTWIQGRHNRGQGFEDDCHKNNAAMELGWKVFHLTSGMINTKNITAIIETINNEFGRLEP